MWLLHLIQTVFKDCGVFILLFVKTREVDLLFYLDFLFETIDLFERLLWFVTWVLNCIRKLRRWQFPIRFKIRLKLVNFRMEYIKLTLQINLSLFLNFFAWLNTFNFFSNEFVYMILCLLGHQMIRDIFILHRGCCHRSCSILNIKSIQCSLNFENDTFNCLWFAFNNVFDFFFWQLKFIKFDKNFLIQAVPVILLDLCAERVDIVMDLNDLFLIWPQVIFNYPSHLRTITKVSDNILLRSTQRYRIYPFIYLFQFIWC